eukprot:sb/3478627/
MSLSSFSSPNYGFLGEFTLRTTYLSSHLLYHEFGNEITPPRERPGGREHVGVIISLVQTTEGKKFLCPNYKTERSNFLNIPRKLSELPLHTRNFRYFGH